MEPKNRYLSIPTEGVALVEDLPGKLVWQLELSCMMVRIQ